MQPSAGPPAESKPPKKRRNNRDWSGAAIGLGLGLGGVFIGRLGALWIRFDVFSQFEMQFFFLAFACLLGLFMPRYKSLCAGVLFVVLLGFYGLWPLLGAGGYEMPAMQGEKRLVAGQFNVHGVFTDNDELASAIRGLNPDVMTLVELTQRNKPLLDALKADWPYQATCWGEADCQFAIISKFPLDNVSSQLEWVGASYMKASLGAEFGGLTVVGVHTTRFPFARAQFIQVQELARILEAVRGPLLVMGDFNATPFSRVTFSFAETLGLMRQTSKPSWPANRALPQLAIDHIFTSNGIRALNNEHLGSSGGSDHFPVAITLAVQSR